MESTEANKGFTGSIMKCAFYGRFSTVMQRRASIEDQLRSCRELADSKGWILLEEHIYRDEAKSGTSQKNRSGLASLKTAAKSKPRPFDCVLFDDTSRLGRKVTDVLLVAEELIGRGVSCFFVGQNLDSRYKEQFDMMLPILASLDQNQIERMRKKAEAGQRGRFLNGYHIGPIPYGYRGTRDDDPSALSNSRQGATLGTKLLVVQSEALTIIRIMQEFSAGNGMLRIARMLNNEGVPWPTDAKGSARCAAGWTTEAIKRILHNERYVGRNFYKKSRIVKDFSTEKITKQPLEANEIQWRDATELRIVTDELWNAVQLRLAALGEKNAARYKGGFARATETMNPWSGSLLCGLCGRALTLGGKQGRSTYGCPNYRSRHGCTNHLRIRCERATEQISKALSELLLDPDIFNLLVPGVYRHLKSEWDCLKRGGDELTVLTQERNKVVRAISSLLGYVENGTTTPSISDRLRDREADKLRLESKISAMKAAAQKEPTLVSLRSLVSLTVSELGRALEADPQEARDVLQKHVRLNFYPSLPGEPPSFVVVGDVHFLEGFTENQKQVALLGRLGTQATQQHDPKVMSFWLRVDPTTDIDSPVLNPLLKLLADRPELSEEPRTGKEWAILMKPYVPSSWTRNLGSGAIGRYFSVDRERLEKHLVMTRTPMTRKTGPQWQLSIRDATRLHT